MSGEERGAYGESWPTVDAYLYAWKEDSPIGRALAIHYPAENGEGPPVCAVCYFWGGSRFADVTPEPWPCPTVQALMPSSQKTDPETPDGAR